MPAMLIALWELIKVGTGVVKAIASTAILLAAFAVFVASFLGLSHLIKVYATLIDSHIVCLMSVFGIFTCAKIALSLVASAFAIRFSRFLAIRVSESLNSVSP